MSAQLFPTTVIGSMPEDVVHGTILEMRQNVQGVFCFDEAHFGPTVVACHLCGQGAT